MQVSIVNYSQIDKKVFRIEAEFYASNSLLNIDCFTGDEIIALEQYNSIYGLNSNGKGYPVLRMNEFHGIFTGKANQHSENFSDDDFYFHSLNKGDILICRTNGNPKLVGKSALVAKDYPYVYESHLFKIRTDSNLITPETLVVYLNTFYGKLEIEKFSMQGNQANFSLAKFKEMRIPKFSKKLNHFIERIVNSSFLALSNSERSYQQSEAILLLELGLTNWQSKHQLSFIKNYSDAEQAGRIDAEYYQPKYEEIIKVIKNYSGGWDTLENLCKTKRGSLISEEYYSDEGVLYIRGADFSGGTLSSKKGIYISSDFNHKNETTVKDGEIVFSLIGSVGETAFVTSEFEGAYISNNTGKISCNKHGINSWVLQILLQSFIGQMYFEKHKTQTAQPKISNKDIYDFVIPILSKEKQTQIQKKIIESFRLHQQSKRLLESAKKAVEIAIKQDEQTAIKQLKQVI